jgi:Protein of unknown function (DUF3987)
VTIATDRLSAFAGPPEEKLPRDHNSNGKKYEHRLKVPEWLSAHGVKFKERKLDDGTAYNIECPFDQTHNGTDAAVIQFRSGLTIFKCQHDSCLNKQWKDCKEQIGTPEWHHYDPPIPQPAKATVGKDKDSGADDTWPELIPLCEVPEPAPFPLEVFPEGTRRFVEAVGRALNAPVDLVAVPTLAVAAGAIGGAVAISIKPGYTEPPVIFAAVVGEPGEGKSPAVKEVTKPLWRRQAERKVLWQHEREAYELKKKQYEQAEREWIKEGSKGDKPVSPGPPPVLTRFLTTDCTPEALAPLLEANQKGIIAHRDEVIGWVRSMDKYSGGDRGERQLWCSFWSAESACIDRVKDRDRGPILLQKPHVTMIGGLVPSKLATLRGDARAGDDRDGFMDRLLLSFPTPYAAAGETWNDIQKHVADQWDRTLGRLLSPQPSKEANGTTHARVIPLGRDARAEWLGFTQRHAVELNDPDFAPHLRGPWAKLRAYGARLALVLCLMRWAEGDDLEPVEVDALSMKHAAALVAYFKTHLRKVHGCLELDRRVRDAQRVVAWLQRQFARFCEKREPCTASVRDIHAGVMGGRRRVEETEEVITLLVKHNYLRVLATKDHPGPGRKPSVRYEVHPSLMDTKLFGSGSQNSQNLGNEEVGI